MTGLALAQLAERVMCCAKTAPDPGYDIGRGTYCIETYVSGGSSVWLRQQDSSTSAIWRPHENPSQALALLEACCLKVGGYFKIIGHPGVTCEVLIQRSPTEVIASSDGQDLATAATLAVCRAMGIDPEAEA